MHNIQLKILDKLIKAKKQKIVFCFFVVPYGLDLSNFIDDFQAIREMMNSQSWKTVML